MSGGHEHTWLRVGTPEHDEWLARWVAERRPRFEADPELGERAARVAGAVAAVEAMEDAAERLAARAEELVGSMGPDVRALAGLDPTFRSFCPPLTPEQADDLASVYGADPADEGGR